MSISSCWSFRHSWRRSPGSAGSAPRGWKRADARRLIMMRTILGGIAIVGVLSFLLAISISSRRADVGVLWSAYATVGICGRSRGRVLRRGRAERHRRVGAANRHRAIHRPRCPYSAGNVVRSQHAVSGRDYARAGGRDIVVARRWIDRAGNRCRARARIANADVARSRVLSLVPVALAADGAGRCARAGYRRMGAPGCAVSWAFCWRC